MPNQARVLLAEDNQINMMIAACMLERVGYLVDRAQNGREAVDAYICGGDGAYDAVILDIDMPVMDGHCAARAIRESGRRDARSIPILALTANTDMADVRASFEAGMNAHLTKPFDPRAMLRTLEVLLCRPC